MSLPHVPDFNPDIDITIEESINLLITSIAMEEIGLSHIINAEAEKIQYVLGTLTCGAENPPTSCIIPPSPVTIDDLIKIDNSVEKMLRNVIKTQMLLQFKLEDTLAFTTSSTTSTSSSSTGESQ